jgi:cytochrome c-type biogenesis protein CcsB
MSQTPLSLALFWVAVVAYLVALLAFVVSHALRRRVIADVGLAAVLVGWPFHLSSIITRALEAGHWPLGNMYEYSTAIALIVVTTFLVLALRAKVRLVGVPAMVVAIALLGVAYMLYVPPGNLVPALHSYWLTIHVTAMATASGILTFSFLFGMFYLARRWADRRLDSFAASRPLAVTPGGTPVSVGGGATGGSRSLGVARTVARVLPTARSLDDWSYRFVMLGFPIWSFGVICGAIWGEHAWGRYWGWDPKETFAFITWVVFAIYLHARVTYGWREVRAAAITAVGFVSIMFTLYAVNLWIAGLHSYAKA